MFSAFFGRKKTTDSPPENSEPPIPSHDSTIPPAPQGDEFIFVERKEPNPTGPGMPRSLYPALGPTDFGRNALRQHNTAPVPYTQGIPFKLAPELSGDESNTRIQMELDALLALVSSPTKYPNDYDFSLERGLVG